MKTTIRILNIFFAVLLLVVAAAFAVIEGRLVVSGDWLLHEMPIWAFLCYFSRFVLAVLGGSFACYLLGTIKKK